MKRLFVSIALAGASAWLGAPLLAQEELPREPAPVAADNSPRIADQAEPLTRGPVHEAFAQAVTPAAEAGLIVKTEPPPIIDEIPPSQRPTGDDIAWIPGYWGWDDDRKDFIWISGIWRALPPGREWVPGYWAKVSDGYQWISGYWADQRIEEVEYLPEPPETVDAGPSTASPSGDEIWIPGTWVWQQNKYVWRAGYWSHGNQRWIWTNAHYVYTPRGYLYVSGYWDFLVPQRGVLFSPVYFSGSIPRNYVYSPRMVVNTVALTDHLFLRPTYRHYYFGDYYGGNYRGRGILPYFVFHNSRYGFDSLYSYNRWNNRNDRNWERRVESRYEDLRDHEDGRPPRDFATWKDRYDRDRNNDRSSFLVGSYNDIGRMKGQDWKFSNIDDDARRSAGKALRDLDDYRQNRLKTESEKTARKADDRGSDRVRLLKPPITDDATQPGPDRDRAGREDRAGRDDRPGRDADDRPRLDRPTGPRIDSKGPAGARASDGTIPPREAPKNPRDLPGPLNDIRDQPRDTPKGANRNDPDNDGRPGVTSPRTLPGSDNELPNRPKSRDAVPKGDAGKGKDRDPVVRPPVTSPRTLPGSDNELPNRPKPRADAPRDNTPKAAPPREAPKVNPMPNPAPRAPSNAPGPRAGGGGRPEGGNQGKGGGKRD